MTMLASEHDLPENGFSTDYIRLKSDPMLLINSRSGDLFSRVDGLKWEWPGYVVAVDTRTERRLVTREAKMACGDRARYPYPPDVTGLSAPKPKNKAAQHA